MGLLGKRASAEDVASTSNVALLVNGFKDLELSRSDGRKTLTAEVLKTLDEEVTFLVRSSDLSSGKYYGCSWSKAMLEGECIEEESH